MKRMITAAVVAVVLVVGTGSASAADGGATVETFPVSFVLSSVSCPNLPDGTVIEGAGTEKSITRTRTDRSGVTTIGNTSIAHGTASDQAGNTYVFLYSNEFRVSNSVADLDVFTGLMTDHFSLAGRGPAKLSNGFTARFSTDFAEFASFEQIHAQGDPISFPEGIAHCDPL